MVPYSLLTLPRQHHKQSNTVLKRFIQSAYATTETAVADSKLEVSPCKFMRTKRSDENIALAQSPALISAAHSASLQPVLVLTCSIRQ